MAELSSTTMRLPAATPRRASSAAILVAVPMLGLDQLSKFIVVHRLALPQHRVIELLPFFALRWEENNGISTSYLRAGNAMERW